MTEITSTMQELAVPAVDPEAMQQIREALDKVVEAVKEVISTIAEALLPVIRAIAKTFDRLIEAIARGIVPGKWLHLAKHAKKARTRKKYRNRIRKEVLAVLKAAAGGEQ